MDGKTVVYTCPKCGVKFIGPKSSKTYALSNIGEHVLFEHIEVVIDWFKKNPKRWSYVRSELVRCLGSNKSVGIVLDGTALVPYVDDLVTKLRKTKDPSILIELKEKLKEYEQKERESESKGFDEWSKWWSKWFALNNLLQWIGLYWAERALVK